MPQFAILIYERETPNGMADMPPEVMEAHGNVEGLVKESGGSVVAGFATEQTKLARSIRGEDVTTGAFHADNKQHLSGFFVVEARDIDHAVEIGKFVPIMDGGVEVRPLLG
ncbi:YciI family protein [Actinokineospora sp. 24-640]